MFEGILGALTKFSKLISWFITAVVIPVTIWFTVLRHDIQSMKTTTSNLQTRMDNNDSMLAQRLEEMNRSLGRIEGELKRIK
jgi:hypothetical protein